MKKYKIFICIGIAACFLAGCGAEKTPDFITENDTEENMEENINPFEEDSVENQNTQVAGSISHGVVWEDDTAEELNLQYEGGEMELPYRLNASGIAASSGFLIYIDGIPQPYKIKGVSETYRYMQVLEVEENQDEFFSFSFYPVTGKEGDRLSICIVSLINPGFKPDMKETVSYGHSHKVLEVNCPMKFLCDAEQAREESDEIKRGHDLNISTSELVQEELDKYTEYGWSVSLDTDVITELYINEQDMLLPENFNIGEEETIHIKYRIMGHPGAKYKTVFYLDHTPIIVDNEDAFASELKNGEVSVIEFDLDVSDINSATFYAVSVPCNKEDYPDDGLFLYKSNSILLYHE